MSVPIRMQSTLGSLQTVTISFMYPNQNQLNHNWDKTQTTAGMNQIHNYLFHAPATIKKLGRNSKLNKSFSIDNSEVYCINKVYIEILEGEA